MAKSDNGTDKAPVSKQVSIRADLYDRLAKEADRREVSVSYLASRAVDRALPAWEGADLLAAFPVQPEGQ